MDLNVLILYINIKTILNPNQILSGFHIYSLTIFENCFFQENINHNFNIKKNSMAEYVNVLFPSVTSNLWHPRAPQTNGFRKLVWASIGIMNYTF